MDSYANAREMYYMFNGKICASPLLRSESYDAALGEIWTTTGEHILFKAFHAYTSIKGFAAYVHRDDESFKLILINRANIARIFITN